MLYVFYHSEKGLGGGRNRKDSRLFSGQWLLANCCPISDQQTAVAPRYEVFGREGLL